MAYTNYDGKCGSCYHMNLRDYDWTSGCLCTYYGRRYAPDYDAVDRLGCSNYQYCRSNAEVDRIIDER